jgi:hypothetical protein
MQHRKTGVRCGVYTEVFMEVYVEVYNEVCKVRSINIPDEERGVEDYREKRRNKTEQVGLQARQSSKEARTKEVW